jgi:flavin-binding protein dodecin
VGAATEHATNRARAVVSPMADRLARTVRSCIARSDEPAPPMVPYTQEPARPEPAGAPRITKGRADMGVTIIREMVGTSPQSWSEAARVAVTTASRTVRNIREIEVVKQTARVSDGQITEYRVEVKIHFEYEGG